MSKTWPKVIRDPVHNIIPFEDTECDRLLLNLINAKEFQRLRRVKQLGLCEMVFPGANHSRFAHSIGVMHTARMFLERVERITGHKLEEDKRILVLSAALLHDVGHGPFSHAFEKVTKKGHEAYTLQIIQDKATEVHSRLSEIDGSWPQKLPGLLGFFFDKGAEESETSDSTTKPEIAVYLGRIVSGQLDADRFDYLIRDSYATGADYGNFDLRWMIQHLYLNEQMGRFFLSSKARSAAEAYVFARYHMYRTVYFHKTVRAAEVMLRLVFQRYKDLLENEETTEARSRIVPNVQPNLVQAFSGDLTLAQFLLLDDYAVTEFLKCCQDGSDPCLQQLGSGLVHRRLFKAVDTMDAQIEDLLSFSKLARDRVKELKLDPDYAFVEDTPADTPYKPYDPEADEPVTQIYIENAVGKQVELSTLSDAVTTLKKNYTLVRYYFPEAIREEIDRIARRTLRKEKP
jgi:HD superfamily phosphohydrolase